MVPSAACECGAEEQTVDHLDLQCPTTDVLTDCTVHGLATFDSFPGDDRDKDQFKNSKLGGV